MTGKERIKRIVAHQEPDKVPVAEYNIDCKVATELLGKQSLTGGGEYEKNEISMLLVGLRDALVEKHIKDTLELYHNKLNLDAVPVHIVHPKDVEMPNVRKIDEITYYYGDPYGTGSFETRKFDPVTGTFLVLDSSFDKDGLAMIEKWLKVLQADKPFQLKPSQFEMIDKIKEKVGYQKALIARHRTGLPPHKAWAEALAQRPELIAAYLDCQLQIDKVYIKAYVEKEVAVILGGSDIAAGQEPLYPVEKFREIFVPRLKVLADICHSMGSAYLFCSSGNTKPFWECFKEIGVDGLACIDINAGMNIGEIKDYFGGNFIIFGGVDSVKTLASAEKEEIENTVKDCIQKIPRQNLILSSSGFIHRGIPSKNYIFMLEAARQYGEYSPGTDADKAEKPEIAPKEKTEAPKTEELQQPRETIPQIQQETVNSPPIPEATGMEKGLTSPDSQAVGWSAKREIKESIEKSDIPIEKKETPGETKLPEILKNEKPEIPAGTTPTKPAEPAPKKTEGIHRDIPEPAQKDDKPLVPELERTRAPLTEMSKVVITREEFTKEDKTELLEKKLIYTFLICTLAVFAIGGIYGHLFKLEPIDWILKCVAVELMLMVGTIVTGTFIWSISSPDKKINALSLTGLAFYLFYWIFYLTWDMGFVAEGKEGILTAFRRGWLISSAASLVFVGLGELWARKKGEKGLGVWAVSITFWFITFYFLFFATG